MNETKNQTENGQVPCGLYRTTKPLKDGRVPAGVLVYYHNHGNPGPGVYPVERWSKNQAIFAKRGVVIEDDDYAQTLEKRVDEGFYRVKEAFYCCEKHCQHFEENLLVQLGYNGHGEPILFVPIWSDQGLEIPEKGTKVGEDRLTLLSLVKVARRTAKKPEEAIKAPPPGRYLH